MKFKEKDRQLTILIEDEYDWLETFDASNTSNIIERIGTTATAT